MDIGDVEAGEAGTVSDDQQAGGGQRRAGTGVLPAPADRTLVLLEAAGAGRLTGQHRLAGQQQPGEGSQHLSDCQSLSHLSGPVRLSALSTLQSLIKSARNVSTNQISCYQDRFLAGRGKSRFSVSTFLFELVF